MDTAPEPSAVAIILIGLLLAVDLLLTALARRIGVSSVVVHLGLGFALALGDGGWATPGEPARDAVDLLGRVGIVFLLFRVGLESNVAKLLENLRGATLIWIADVSVSGGLGFAMARYVLDLELVPSLFVALAMTVTSVGVAIVVWREEDALDTKRGQLLIDVAELDDISGIVMMAVLFAVAPLLAAGETEALALAIGTTTARVLAGLAFFGLGIALFARFAEARLTGFISRIEPKPDRLLTVVSVGLVVAAAAAGLGYSLAIGAFFGGLAFSRDPEAVKLDVYFDPLYGFFTPFFFISIALNVDPGSLGTALPLGLALLTIAVLGKLLGAGGGSLISLRPSGAALLGLSMVPRAEIAMVIMQYGAGLGAWAVPNEILSAMVVVSMLTCLLSPLAIRALLRRAGSGAR